MSCDSYYILSRSILLSHKYLNLNFVVQIYEHKIRGILELLKFSFISPLIELYSAIFRKNHDSNRNNLNSQKPTMYQNIIRLKRSGLNKNTK